MHDKFFLEIDQQIMSLPVDQASPLILSGILNGVTLLGESSTEKLAYLNNLIIDLQQKGYSQLKVLCQSSVFENSFDLAHSHLKDHLSVALTYFGNFLSVASIITLNKQFLENGYTDINYGYLLPSNETASIVGVMNQPLLVDASNDYYFELTSAGMAKANLFNVNLQDFSPLVEPAIAGQIDSITARLQQLSELGIL